MVAAAAEDEERPWLAMDDVHGLTLRQHAEDRGTLAAAMGAALGTSPLPVNTPARDPYRNSGLMHACRTHVTPGLGCYAIVALC
ncbi:hypothetical protein Acsp03_37620 [Actinomadura sp. NBRC 104412]|nr:hypothetical protein Acsp03_37620 [Actinomadura sp. NBRC 104412]